MANSPPFEIGLTLAGAVSAGAYTAGVVDFLIEALDAWEAEKARCNSATSDPRCPVHEVNLRVLSGASAGAIVGAIVAANIDRSWTPVNAANADDPHVRNPLFDSWVNQVDVHSLLGERDLQSDAMPVSVLDATALDGIAQSALSYQSPAISRRYVANPLRAVFALTNLTGVPFRYDLRGNSGYGQDLTLHADHMRFAVEGAGGAPAPARRNALDASYEHPLAPTPGPKWSDANWQRFAMASLASGAFPLGLRPRTVVRSAFEYRGMQLPIADASGAPLTIGASWTLQPQAQYQFLSADGGCVDNEPLQLARVELSGNPLASNPRDGLQACKALIMVDPFVGPSAAGPSTVEQNPLHLALFKLLNASIGQSRFSAEDIELAYRADVYSRFMVAPKRPTPASLLQQYPQPDGKWLASGALGGFSGFFHRAFRKHDFLLGRRNCQLFLFQHFTLPLNNPLFSDWAHDAELQARYSVPGQDGEPTQLPIIPLVGALHPKLGHAEPVPDWPLDACDVGALRAPIGARADALFKKYNHDTGIAGLALGALWRFWGRGKVLDKTHTFLLRALKEQGLIS